MDYLEKKLNRLPREKLSIKKKISLKLNLYFLDFYESKNNFFVKNFNFRLVSFFLFLIILFGLPVYSYASASVTRNNIFYPLKIGIERFELAMVSSEEDKIEKYQKFSERRLDEGEFLSSKIKTEENRETLKLTIDDSLNLKNIASDISKKINEDKKDEIFVKNEVSSSKQKEKLNKIAFQVGIKEDENLIEKIAEAMELVSTGSQSSKQEAELVELNSNFLNVEKDNLPASINKKINKAQELEKQVQDLRVELNDDYNEDDLEKLFEKLDRRVEEVNRSIDEGDIKNVNGLISSTKAISNNAKFFIKEKDNRDLNIKRKKEKK